MGLPGDGVGGEKGLNQEEHGPAWHLPDTEPEIGDVIRVGTCATKRTFRRQNSR